MDNPGLFLSYRTSDTRTAATGLARALKREFDPGLIFIDYLGIEGGEPWGDRLAMQLDQATVLFVLIGNQWLETVDKATGRRRIDRQDDWVRKEIETFLRCKKTIVPILVDDASPLQATDLPFSLQPLARLQTRPLHTATSFDSDVRGLINLLQAQGFERSTHPWRVNPDSVYQRVELDHFVGRGWLTERLDEFLRTNSRGYFVIEATAGLGKTSFLAHLVETRGYFHHFVELLPGTAGVVPGLRNLAAQIITAFGLEPAWIDDLLSGLDTRSDFLERLLVAAASRTRAGDGPVVLVVDGLDQAGTPPGQNVLGLPRELPEGFYFVVSQRPVEIRLQVDAPRAVVSIDANCNCNLQDIADYVRRWLSAEGDAAAEIARRSQGNWVYLYYVCREVNEGRRDPHDLQDLPHGLWQYYARFFQDWRRAHDDQWDAVDLPLLSTLSAIQEGLRIDAISDYAGVHAGTAYRLLTNHWRPFVTVTPEQDGEHFQVYHRSLADFVGGRTSPEGLESAERAFANELSRSTKATHGRIAGIWLERWGGAKLDGLRGVDGVDHRLDYGWRHVVVHQAQSGDWALLERLLRAEWAFHEEVRVPVPGVAGGFLRWWLRRQHTTQLSIARNAWFESHAHTGDLTLFLEDWGSAVRIARSAGDISASDMLELEVLSYLVTSSVRDAARQVPAGLVIALVRSGRWTADQAVAFARRVADHSTRVAVLTEIAALDLMTRPTVLRDAVETIDFLEDPSARVAALARLLAVCRENEREALLIKALSMLPGLDDAKLVDLAPAVVPYLTPSRWSDYLSQVQDLRNPLLRLQILAASAKMLKEPSELEEPLKVARREVLAQVESRKSEKRFGRELGDGAIALRLALLASLSDGEEALQYADRALGFAIRAIRANTDLDEQPYEAIAVLASSFPDRVSGEFLASTITRLLPREYWKDASGERELIAKLGLALTPEQVQSRLAARLISVTPRHSLGLVEKALLQTQPEFNDWDAYRDLALRYAELGESKRALKVTQRIRLTSVRHRTLAAIAPYLDEHSVRQAIKITDTERSRLFSRTLYSDIRFYEEEQATTVIDALVGLLPRLAELGREQEALMKVRQLGPARGGGEWFELLSGLARHASTQGLETLLRMSMEFRDLDHGACALAALAAFLPAETVRKAVPAIRHIGYSRNKRTRWGRSRTFIAGFDLRRRSLHFVACRLAELGHPEEALQELLLFIQTAQREGDFSWGVAETLAVISPSLGPELLEVALVLVRQHDWQHQPSALGALASRLTPELLPRALALARGNPEAGFRAWGIGALLSRVDEESRSAMAKEALDTLPDRFFERPRVIGLIGAYHEEARSRVRELVREHQDAGITCLVHMLPRADGPLAHEMIALACHHYDDSETLALSEYLDEPEFWARLNRVLANEPEALRNHDERIVGVCRRLAKLGRASSGYRLALMIKDPQLRDRTVLPMARALAELPREEIMSLWDTVSRDWPDSTRTEAFAYVAALGPLLHAVGGQDQIEELMSVVREALRWWM